MIKISSVDWTIKYRGDNMIFDYFGNKFRPKWIDIKDKESMMGYHINQKLI